MSTTRSLASRSAKHGKGFTRSVLSTDSSYTCKEAPKNQDERRHRRENEHLDAAAGVDGIEDYFEQCVANGVTILKPLTPTAWGTKDFYVDDPDGYIICFGGR